MHTLFIGVGSNFILGRAELVGATREAGGMPPRNFRHTEIVSRAILEVL